jgi:glycosyltransferase involved in cell wall biosynthesis
MQGGMTQLKNAAVREVRTWKVTWWLLAAWTRLRGALSWLAAMSRAMAGEKSRTTMPPEFPAPHVLIVCAHFSRSDRPRLEWLRACVDSVIAQDFKNWTLMLVDDASPGNDAKLIEEMCQQDARIKGWQLEENSGAYIARNTAVACANLNRYGLAGDAPVPWTHLTLIDSDDVAAPDWLSHVLAVMGEDQGLVRCVLERQDIELTRTHRRLHSYCQTLYSRKFWEKLGGFHPVRVAADDEFLVRARRLIALSGASFTSRFAWKTGQYMRSHDHNASDAQPIERKIWTTQRRREIAAARTGEALLLKSVVTVEARPLFRLDSES